MTRASFPAQAIHTTIMGAKTARCQRVTRSFCTLKSDDGARGGELDTILKSFHHSFDLILVADTVWRNLALQTRAAEPTLPPWRTDRRLAADRCLETFDNCRWNLSLGCIKAQDLFGCGELPGCGALLLMLRCRKFLTLLLLKAFGWMVHKLNPFCGMR